MGHPVLCTMVLKNQLSYFTSVNLHIVEISNERIQLYGTSKKLGQFTLPQCPKNIIILSKFEQDTKCKFYGIPSMGMEPMDDTA